MPSRKTKKLKQTSLDNYLSPSKNLEDISGQDSKSLKETSQVSSVQPSRRKIREGKVYDVSKKREREKSPCKIKTRSHQNKRDLPTRKSIKNKPTPNLQTKSDIIRDVELVPSIKQKTKEQNVDIQESRLRGIKINTTQTKNSNNPKSFEDFLTEPDKILMSKRKIKEGKVFNTMKTSKSGGSSIKNSNLKKQQNSPSIEKFLQKKSTNNNRRSSSKSENQKSPSKSEPENKRFKRTGSDSFYKYGVLLPSVDEILKKQEKKKREAEALASFKNSHKQLPVPKLLDNLMSDENFEEDYDCKHLKDTELESLFMENLSYIRKVSAGKVHCERHLLYENETEKSKLVYNTSTLVFTQEQRDFLLHLLLKHVNIENTEYVLMVLMPELCLNIFMKTHNMQIQKAIDYLEWRPCN